MDYICPFCYVGSKRLMHLREHYDLRVNWCLIEIHPDTPRQTMPIEELGYDQARRVQMDDDLSVLAAAEGIKFTQRRWTTNSHDALRLAEAAKLHASETFYELHDALFSAYFEQQLNIGDRDVLMKLGQDCGLPREKIEQCFGDQTINTRLAWYLDVAGKSGVTGVPTYVIGQRMMHGVRSLDELLEAARDVA